MIALYTDFGVRGPYVGQVHAVLARRAGALPVIDLMHDAPTFDARAAGHLLAALAADFPAGTVFVGVVDPGVGTERPPVAVDAGGQWFVGPGNGLFDVIAARAGGARWWRLTRAPERASQTFHGRDLFAPVAAVLARGGPVPGEPMQPPLSTDTGGDLGQVIYVDGFGNAMTGLRAPERRDRRLHAGDHALPGGRTFADAAPGEGMWLVNSIGLVEVVVNRGSAAERLGLAPGTPVAWDDAG